MPTSAPISISTHDEVAPEDADIVDAGLEGSNRGAAPLHAVLPLACFARTPAGAVVGGAVGRTWGLCCELQQLWVHPGQRRKGLARRLVRAFEERAEARGCRRFYLETFSFQAPSLYRSLGYHVKLEVRGFPSDIVKYTMVRETAGGEGG